MAMAHQTAESFTPQRVAEPSTGAPAPSAVLPSVNGGDQAGSSSSPGLVAAVRRFARTEDGQDLLEYGMLVVLIAGAAVVAVERVGSTINAVLWQAIAASNY
jgi:Flp pilus assembly pilin Flp